jgi:ABC-type lipoprotein export system ATPase subunit
MQIAVRNLIKQFDAPTGVLTVLNDISCTFEQGGTYAITGRSGSGKSTLLHLLGGLDMPTTGTVFWDNRDVQTLTVHEKEQLLQNSFGLVFQLPYLIGELTVEQNIMLKGLIAGGDTTQQRARAQELLAFAELTDKAQALPATLSGGQQQRVAVLRALFNKPAFVILDEPTGNLDEASGEAILDLLLDAQRTLGMGIIISSHDPKVVERMQIVYTLHEGHLTLCK